MPGVQQGGLADGDTGLGGGPAQQRALGGLTLARTPHVVVGHLLEEENQHPQQQHLGVNQQCASVRPLAPLARLRQLGVRGAATCGARPEHVGTGEPGEQSTILAVGLLLSFCVRSRDSNCSHYMNKNENVDFQKAGFSSLSFYFKIYCNGAIYKLLILI